MVIATVENHQLDEEFLVSQKGKERPTYLPHSIIPLLYMTNFQPVRFGHTLSLKVHFILH